MDTEMTERQSSEWLHSQQHSHLVQTDVSTLHSELSFMRVHPSMFSFCPKLASNYFSEDVIQMSPYNQILSLLNVSEGGHYVDLLKLTLSIVNQDEHNLK